MNGRESILRCIKCMKQLENNKCRHCKKNYCRGGIVIALNQQGKKLMRKQVREHKKIHGKKPVQRHAVHQKKYRQYLTKKWFQTIKKLPDFEGKEILVLGALGINERKAIKNKHVTIVDINPHALEMNKEKNYGKDTFVCADFHNLPFNNNSFDVILSNSILHHAGNNFGKETLRVLKKGGNYYGINETFFQKKMAWAHDKKYSWRQNKERKTFEDYQKIFSEYTKVSIKILKKPVQEANTATRIYYRIIQFLPDKIVKHLSSRILIKAVK